MVHQFARRALVGKPKCKQVNRLARIALEENLQRAGQTVVRIAVPGISVVMVPHNALPAKWGNLRRNGTPLYAPIALLELLRAKLAK